MIEDRVPAPHPETLVCAKCGPQTFYTRENKTALGAYCDVCDRWIKWLSRWCKP